MSYCYIFSKIYVKIHKKEQFIANRGDKMLDFNEIMYRLKTHLYQQSGERIYDKDLAQALELDATYYAVIKRRKKIPYQAILLFANNHNISLNWIFFNKFTESK